MERDPEQPRLSLGDDLQLGRRLRTEAPVLDDADAAGPLGDEERGLVRKGQRPRHLEALDHRFDAIELEPAALARGGAGPRPR
jgi:hypothetical protein